MGRTAVIQSKAKVALCVLVSVCMAAGLFPAIALADTTLHVQVEKPAQVNEVVPVGEKAIEKSGTDEVAVDPDAATQEDPVVGSRASETQAPTHITTDVVIGTDTASVTVLVSGLTYEVNQANATATLTGWYGKAPAGDLTIPAQVKNESSVYDVTSIGISSHNANDSNTRNSLGGAWISALLNSSR